MNLSDAEWKVMQALWERHPASVRELLEQLEDDTGWAYSTLKTLLERLVEKGAARSRASGRQRVYTPALQKRRARREAVSGLLSKAFEGRWEQLFHHLGEEHRLSPAEREELRAMLRKLDDDA